MNFSIRNKYFGVFHNHVSIHNLNMYHVHGVNAPIAKGAISVQVSKTPYNYFDGKDWCLLVSDSGG